MADAAAKVNSVVLGVLERVLGVSIPQDGEGHSYTCPLEVEVRGLRGMSFQSLLTSLPIKKGGLGLRNPVQLSAAAYVGGLEQALTYFGGERGVCPPLAALGGGEMGTENRWRPLVETEGRTPK